MRRDSMKIKILMISLITIVPILSGCETIRGTANGMAKDAENAGAATYATGKAIAGSFGSSGDAKENPPKEGVIQKTDNWVKQHLW